MGILRALNLVQSGSALTVGGSSATTGILSPFQVGAPSKIVWSDLFDAAAVFITRAEAMSLPPVAKGRAIIAGQIANAPLRAYDETGPLADQPEWLYRTEGAVSPFLRDLWTVDDLIFTGYSLWGVKRDGTAEDAPIVSADRIPVEWWHFDADGKIIVQDEAAQSRDVILIPGPSEGFLEFGTRTIRGAVALEASYVKRAQNPIPLVELHENVDSGLEEGEADELVQAYVDARQDVNGTVVFTPNAIQLVVHGEQSPQLAIEGRNYVKVDVANFLNLPAAALDGSLSTASLTYSTQEGQRNEIADYSLSYWAGAIDARLSQDDVIPRGQRIRHDFADLRSVTPSPTGPIVKD